MRDRLHAYFQLMRLDKPIGTFLLLWPTLWALWLANNGLPPLSIIIIFSLGAFVMRSAGCVINDFADREFDGHVERTKHRPLAAGKVSPREVIGLFIALLLIALSFVLFLPAKVLIYACLAAILTIIYPYMKRYIQMPQMVLGIAFAWGIPMAYIASIGYVPGIAWLLFLTIVIWVLIYDTQYAMVDRIDDLRIGIQSTAIFFGSYDRVVIAVLQIGLLSLLILIGYLKQLTMSYYLSLILAAGLMFYQQYLIRQREPASCFKAFLNNNYLGLVVFIGIVLSFYTQ